MHRPTAIGASSDDGDGDQEPQPIELRETAPLPDVVPGVPALPVADDDLLILPR